MPNETVGTTGAEKTGTEAAAVKSETPATGANGAAKETGVEARIKELTGEIGRKDEVLAKTRERVKELENQLKTDDERRIEQLAEAKFKPDLERKMQLEKWAAAERDALLARIPDEHKGMVLTGDNIPVEQQIAQARGVLSLITKSPNAPAFSGGGNPATETKRTYSQSEYQKWSESASIPGQEYYLKHADEFRSAIKDGRVEGFRGK